uniref:Uncharacterized protein n=1 Tax=Meloidogyne floridensis TaxID=298350 RepID=A0A915P121_9BILA
MIISLAILVFFGILLNFVSANAPPCYDGWKPNGRQMSAEQAKLKFVHNPINGKCEQTYCPLGSIKDNHGCSIKGFCITYDQACIKGECCGKYNMPTITTASLYTCNPNNPNNPINPNNPNTPYNPNNPNNPYVPFNPNVPPNNQYSNPNLYMPNPIPNNPTNPQMPGAQPSGMQPVFNSNRQPAYTTAGLPIFTMNGQLFTADGQTVYSNGQPLYTANGQVIVSNGAGMGNQAPYGMGGSPASQYGMGNQPYGMGGSPSSQYGMANQPYGMGGSPSSQYGMANQPYGMGSQYGMGNQPYGMGSQYGNPASMYGGMGNPVQYGNPAYQYGNQASMYSGMGSPAQYGNPA